MTARVGLPVTVTYLLRATIALNRKVVTEGTKRMRQGGAAGQVVHAGHLEVHLDGEHWEAAPAKMSGCRVAMDSMNRTRNALASPGRHKAASRAGTPSARCPKFMAASSSVPPRDSRNPQREVGHREEREHLDSRSPRSP